MSEPARLPADDESQRASRRYPGGTDRERKILVEASRLFFEKGYEAVSVDEIGERAGVSGPAVYRYFQSKDDILAVLFDEVVDGLLTATSGEFEDPMEELRHRARAHAAHVIGDRQIASVYVREDRSLSARHRRRMHHRAHRYAESWVTCVQRCFPDLSHELAIVGTWSAIGTLNSIAHWPAAPLAVENVPDALATFVIAGLESLAASARIHP